MKFVKIISREYSVQYTEMSLRSLRPEAKKHLPAFVFGQFYIPENGNESCYMSEGEWQRFIEALGEKYENEKALKKFIKLFHRYGKNYMLAAGKIGSAKLVRVDDKTLAKYYETYQKALLDYSAYVWMGFLLNNIYSEKAKKILGAKQIGKDEQLSTALFSPAKKIGILKLQDLVMKLKKENKIISERIINKIVKDYAWLSCLDIHNDPWSERDLREFLKNLKIAPRGYSFKKAAGLAGLDKKEAEFFKQARELAYIKDMRDEYRRRGIFKIEPLFSEIAKRAQLSRKELAYFSWQEVKEALEGKIKLRKDEAVSRMKGFLIHHNGKNISVTSEQIAIKKFFLKNVSGKRILENKLIYGVTASPGFARGKAKIILSVRDLPKVKNNDIIIAISTHPDFVPAMHKASAVVTDEGGITSHAAIVSRELGIPCVVGAKIATNILKDGDLVEVDAERGIVKILTKN